MKILSGLQYFPLPGMVSLKIFIQSLEKEVKLAPLP